MREGARDHPLSLSFLKFLEAERDHLCLPLTGGFLTIQCTILINSCKTYKNLDLSAFNDEFQGNDDHVALSRLDSTQS